MSIYEKMQEEKIQRLKQGLGRGLISLLMGEICIDGKPMDDKGAVIRLAQMKKTCVRNIEIYKSTMLLDSADEELFTDKIIEEVVFMELIEDYLPQGAEPNDVLGALAVLCLPRTIKSIGKVMKYLKDEFDVVDGLMVKNILLSDGK